MTTSLTNAGIILYQTGEAAGNSQWVDGQAGYGINNALLEVDKALPTCL